MDDDKNIGVEIDESIAIDDGMHHLAEKSAVCEVKADSADGDTVTAIISTAGVDRDSEVMDPQGADLGDYRKNPVVLWNHDRSAPPIGKALWIKRTKDDIRAKVRFASTAFAQDVFKLFKEGVLKAFSIGFRPVKAITPTKEDIKRNPAWKDARIVFTEWKLYEFSAVPVPANPDALALAVSKGLVSERIIDSFDLTAKTEDDTVETADEVVSPAADGSNVIEVVRNVDEIIVVHPPRPAKIDEAAIRRMVGKAIRQARGRLD